MLIFYICISMNHLLEIFLLRVFFMIIILFIIAITQMAKSSYASDFEIFAKGIIREIGHNHSGPAASEAIRRHLKENRIENPINYFKEQMEIFRVIDFRDKNLSKTDQVWLQRGEAIRLTIFKSRYFDSLITNYSLNVYVWDFPSGKRKVSASITLNAP